MDPSWNSRKLVHCKGEKRMVPTLPQRWNQLGKGLTKPWRRLRAVDYYSPKVNILNLKITPLGRKIESEPNLHDFGFRMLNFGGV